MDELAELLKDPRAGKQTAETISGLSGSDEGAELIRSASALISALVEVCSECIDDSSTGVPFHALACLVNVTADQAFAEELAASSDIIKACVSLILDHAGGATEGAASMLLTNLTRHPQGASKLAALNCAARLLNRLVATNMKATQLEYDHNIDHIASILCNLSQVEEGRAQLMGKDVFPSLLLCSFPNNTRLLGILSTIKNCTVDEERHSEIFDLCDDSPNLSITLVFPIAGGGRPLSQFDMEKMPEEVVELAKNGTACEDVEGRRVALEALLKLCTSRRGRDYFRLQIYFFRAPPHTCSFG